LLKAAEAMIEVFLDWEEQANKPDLTQIEDEVLRLRRQLGQQMAEVAIADQAALQPVEAPLCPKCGVRMRYKGQTVESRVGTLALRRGYYHCSRCRGRVLPPQRSGRATG
jgi:hypothetical protein